MESVKRGARDVLLNYRPFVALLTPFVLLPLILSLRTSAADCAYVVLLMVIYWVTDALPLPVTGLLPVVLFPTIGIMSAKDVAKNYITDISLLELGGIMTALAVEQSQFHRRLALRVLLLIGTKPTFILLGMMLPTWFLSMWISNTASATMMLPIAKAVVDQIGEGLRIQQSDNRTESMPTENGWKNRNGQVSPHPHQTIPEHSQEMADLERTYSDREKSVSKDLNGCHGHKCSDGVEAGNGEESMEANSVAGSTPTKMGTEEEVEEDEEEEEKGELQKRLDDFGKMLNLAVVYAATVGGTATLTGTPPNLVLQKYLNTLYESYGFPQPVTFSTWLLFGLPHTVLGFAVTLCWLQFFYLGWRSFCFCCNKGHTSENSEGMRKTIRAEYDTLGPIRFAEVATLVIFILLVLLWFLRDPGVFKGYSSLFKKGYISDAVPAIFIAIFLFIFPAEIPRILCFRKSGETSRRFKPLLEWNDVCSRIPWGLLIILGGGFALADACEISGLSRVIGNQLQPLATLPPWIMVLLIVTIVAFLTEMTSNTAIATIVIPILCQMAMNVNANPLYLTLPAAMATSYAYMLPVATGVNAVVFSYGNLSVLDMVKAGFILKFACILVLIFGIHSWGRLVFDLDLIPWTKSKVNSTAVIFAVNKIVQ